MVSLPSLEEWRCQLSIGKAAIDNMIDMLRLSSRRLKKLDLWSIAACEADVPKLLQGTPYLERLHLHFRIDDPEFMTKDILSRLLFPPPVTTNGFLRRLRFRKSTPFPGTIYTHCFVPSTVGTWALQWLRITIVIFLMISPVNSYSLSIDVLSCMSGTHMRDRRISNKRELNLTHSACR